MKKLTRSVVALCLMLPICILIISLISFTGMKPDRNLCDVSWDSHGVGYFLTDEHELYVGGPNGTHTDSYGLYETGFRWNFLYGTRRLLGVRNAVLFCNDVKEVFNGEHGFLYTNSRDELYYFGSYSNGKKIQVAQRVIAASEYLDKIVYITKDHEVFHTSIENGAAVYPPIKIASGGNLVYIVNQSIRIVDVDGIMYRVLLDDEGKALTESKRICELNIQSMKNDFHVSCMLTEMGELICCEWKLVGSAGVLYADEEKKLSIADNVVHYDIGSFGNIAYITEESKLEVYNIYTCETELAHSLSRMDIIGFGDHESCTTIAYSDGTIEVISH